VSREDARRDLERARSLAKWTDARFLDPLAGLLLPGVGDVLGAAAGLYIVAIGARHRVPRHVVARMLLNLAVDCTAGAIPVLGDLFDFLNRANLRNVRLLEHHLQAPAPDPAAARRSTLLLVAAAVMLAAAAGLALWVTYKLIRRWAS
jgi:hypothetical protein